jgi:hypothetical protein
LLVPVLSQSSSKKLSFAEEDLHNNNKVISKFIVAESPKASYKTFNSFKEEKKQF